MALEPLMLLLVVQRAGFWFGGVAVEARVVGVVFVVVEEEWVVDNGNEGLAIRAVGGGGAGKERSSR